MQKGFYTYIIPAMFDKGTRKALLKYLSNIFKSPKKLFAGFYYQSIMIIQPVDVLPNGDQNMCDGCPDITVWKDKLVWSCRMEEQNRWGENVKMFPKEN